MSGRTGVGIAAALAPAALLAVDPGGWYWFGPVKWLVVTVAVPASAAALWHRHPMRVVRGPTYAALTLVVAMAVAATFGVDSLYAWIGTPERHLGVLTWALCFVALLVGQSIAAAPATGGARHDGHALVLAGLAIAGLGVGAVATAEGLGWEPLVLDVGRRLTGTLGSSAYLGAAGVFLLPVCAGVALERSMRQAMRVTSAIATLLLVVAVLGSGARAAWVGLVVAGAVLLVARRVSVCARPRVVALATLGVVAAVTFLALVTPVGPRVAATFDEGEPGGSGRLDEWRVAARVLVDHPLVGVGPEGYRIAFSEGVGDAYEREHGRDPLPDRAHSAPLDIALSGGVLGLAAWGAFVALAANHAWRAMRDGERWLVGLACGLAAYQVAQLLLFPIGELEPIVWLSLGVVLARTAHASERAEWPVPSVVAPALALIASIALVAGALDIAADRKARDAVDEMAVGETGAALASASRAASLRPDEVRLHLLEARAAIADERGTLTALDKVAEALDVSPDDPIARLERASLLVDRARATLVPDHIERARVEVERMVDDDPHRADLWMLAGHVARLEGDTARAEAAWRRAEELAPRRAAPPAALALLYLELDRRSDAAAAASRALSIDPDDPAAHEVQRRLDGAG